MSAIATLRSQNLRLLSVISVGIVVVACSQDVAAPRAAGRAVPAPVMAAGVTAVTVKAASPDTGSQSTTLDVTVTGSGFESGMVATWELHGVADPNQVRTNSTRFVNSRQVIANITISSDATLAKWDVQVASKGKGGIGTELFTVKINGNIDTTPKGNLVFENTVNVSAPGQTPNFQSALITGDFRDRSGAPLSNGKSGEYQGKFCGFQTIFRSTDGALNAEVDHDYDATTMDLPCGGKRYYQFFFSGRAASPLQYGPQHYVWDLYSFAPGESRLQGIMFGIQQTGCNGLHFNDLYPPSNSARVTRLADTLTSSGTARRWRVESQGNHQAMCTTTSKRGPVPTGVHYYMPFAFTITEVPYPFPHFP